MTKKVLAAFAVLAGLWFTPAIALAQNLTINDVMLTEGNAGTTAITFTVSLTSPAPGGGVTFDIATTDGTALAGSDYTGQSLTGQSIATGNATYTFTVLVTGDIVAEANETFFVNVTNVTGRPSPTVRGWALSQTMTRPRPRPSPHSPNGR